MGTVGRCEGPLERLVRCDEDVQRQRRRAAGEEQDGREGERLEATAPEIGARLRGDGAHHAAIRGAAIGGDAAVDELHDPVRLALGELPRRG